MLREAVAGTEERAHLPSIELSFDERWFVVQTHPLSEERAQQHLAQQGYRSFFPKRHKTIRHARKLRQTMASLFPRYLFVVLDMSRDQWRNVNSTRGVSQLVMRGELPLPVPAGIVDALMASCDSQGIFQPLRPLRLGSTVRVMAGPFAEQVGILDQLDDAGRVRLLLNMLGRDVAVSTNRAYIMPLSC